MTEHDQFGEELADFENSCGYDVGFIVDYVDALRARVAELEAEVKKKNRARRSAIEERNKARRAAELLGSGAFEEAIARAEKAEAERDEQARTLSLLADALCVLNEDDEYSLRDLESAADNLRAERDRLLERERDICRAVGGVSDGGRFRNDIIEHLTIWHRKQAQLDEAREQAERLRTENAAWRAAVAENTDEVDHD